MRNTKSIHSRLSISVMHESMQKRTHKGVITCIITPTKPTQTWTLDVVVY